MQINCLMYLLLRILLQGTTHHYHYPNVSEEKFRRLAPTPELRIWRVGSVLMMEKAGGKKNSSLVRIVQERLMLKKAEEKKKQQQIDAAFASAPHLPQDCVSCILVRLPIDSLQRSRCVCKLWYDMIHRPVIIYSHARCSETVVLFQTLGKKDNATTFSVEACLVGPNHFFDRPDMKLWSKVYLHYMEITDGEEAVIRDFNVSCLGKTMASCNGLILLENKLKKGGLILMNPVTRKVVSLPVGTISLPCRESYSLVLDHTTTKYKVVHLFSDESGYTSCETMEVGARLWKMVNAPSFGLISWFGYKSVSAIGALHWLPHIDHNDYIVSMETGKESFTTIQLPESGKTRDRILEMGGFLCFCTCDGRDELQIWVLKGISDENWTRLHCVSMHYAPYMVPISVSRYGGQITFTSDRDGALYVYDFHLKSLKRIEMRNNVCHLHNSFLPHVNTLVSWSKGEESRY